MKKTLAILAIAAASVSFVGAPAHAALKQPSVYDSVSTSGSASTTYIPRWRF